MKTRVESLASEMFDRGITYSEAVREFRKAFMVTALARNHSNQSKTARALSIHRNTLSRALAELGIAVKRRPPQNVGIPFARKRQYSYR